MPPSSAGAAPSSIGLAQLAGGPPVSSLTIGPGSPLPAVPGLRSGLRDRCGGLRSLAALTAAAAALVAVPTATALTGLGHTGGVLDVVAAGLLLAVSGYRVRELASVRDAVALQSDRYADERTGLLLQVAAEADRSRRQLLAEVHDGPLQTLVVAAMTLEVGLDELAGDLPGRRECAQALVAVHESIAEVRALLSGRGPHAGVPENLPSALAQLVDAHGPQFPAGVSVLCAVDRDLPDPVCQSVYLITREAILNAVKHADADTLTVTAAATDQTLVVSVADDGVGVAAEQLLDARGRGHLGMALMAERSAAVGGTVTVRPQPAGGTVVDVLVPLPLPARM